MRVVVLILLHACLLIARSMANIPSEEMHLKSSSKTKNTEATAALMVYLIANEAEKSIVKEKTTNNDGEAQYLHLMIN